MRVTKAPALVLAAWLVAACDPASRPLGDADKQAIIDSVTAGMRSYAAALGTVQVNQVMGHYIDSPGFRLTSDGKVYTRSAMQEVIAGLSALSKVEVTWDSISVTPLATDAALAVAPFHRADFFKGGGVSRVWGVATWVWVRRDGRWRMLYGHGDHYPDTTATR